MKAKTVDHEAFYDILAITEKNLWLNEHDRSRALLDLWNLCDLRDQQILLKDLFNNFTYIDMNTQYKYEKEVVEKICKDWNVGSNNGYIVSTADPGEVDGSNWALHQLKNHFSSSLGWSERNYFSDIISGLKAIKDDGVLVLLDDFVGSGKTIVRKVKYAENFINKNENINNVDIKVVTFCTMQAGVDHIRRETAIDFFSPLILKRGISDFYQGENIDKNKRLMFDLERKLQNKWLNLKLTDHSLGYSQSETLFQRMNLNCSNNVFPIFWWPKLTGGIDRGTILSRSR